MIKTDTEQKPLRRRPQLMRCVKMEPRIIIDTDILIDFLRNRKEAIAL